MYSILMNLRWPQRQILALGLLATLMSSSLSAQRASGPAVSDPATLEMLLKRIDQLEARVQQLEAERQRGGTVGIAPLPDRTALPHSVPTEPVHPQEPSVAAVEQPKLAPPVVSPVAPPPVAHAPAEQEPMQGESAMAERMDMSKTLLRIRGFGDVDLHGDTQKGDTTSFSLGELDLFVTSDISEKFKFLSEIVFEGGPDNYLSVIQPQKNVFSVDLERYLVRYSHNDYLNISAGRGHTAIGYYNTAYHHSTWLQTTTDRPFLFAFEDSGGILPIHTVGATVSGLIPSGSLGLHYVAEVGNGRESRYPLVDEPVQNEVSDSNHKAFNFAVFARPDAMRGLQTGFSVYRDLLVPANQGAIHETILAAHAVLIRPKFEWLNEVLLDRHGLVSGLGVFNTAGFYTQTSRQLGSFRPYFRYQYVNVPRKEPVFPDVGLRQGPSLGIRYDASESVALKLQYDYTALRDQPAVKGLTLQLGFTF
jgi:hypothetical protein